MLVVGLTGSIGMGKSAAAQRLRALGLVVCDADALVHELYRGAAAAPIEVAFPGTTAAGAVDRQKLAAHLLRDPGGYKRLEAIVHPLVQHAEAECLDVAARRGDRLAVVEVPLLFETGGERRVDATIVVSAPYELQRARVLARPGMTEEKFNQIVSRQLPDAEKRRRADFVVDTGGTLAETDAQIDRIVARLVGRSGTAYERFWRLD
jgi:dephospho-CoA kinase